LTIAFRNETLTDVLDPTAMPDPLIGKAKGEVVIHERGPLLDRLPAVKPEVDQRVRALLEKSQKLNADESRLLFQELHVERVSIQEVVYRYRNSDLKRLWIYGEDQRIHAPGVPRPWGKWILIVVGIIAAVTGIVLVVARS
jgi:hypothetical protein